jgi:hypothetical protein
MLIPPLVIKGRHMKMRCRVGKPISTENYFLFRARSDRKLAEAETGGHHENPPPCLVSSEFRVSGFEFVRKKLPSLSKEGWTPLRRTGWCPRENLEQLETRNSKLETRNSPSTQLRNSSPLGAARNFWSTCSISSSRFQISNRAGGHSVIKRDGFCKTVWRL